MSNQLKKKREFSINQILKVLIYIALFLTIFGFFFCLGYWYRGYRILVNENKDKIEVMHDFSEVETNDSVLEI